MLIGQSGLVSFHSSLERLSWITIDGLPVLRGRSLSRYRGGFGPGGSELASRDDRASGGNSTSGGAGGSGLTIVEEYYWSAGALLNDELIAPRKQSIAAFMPGQKGVDRTLWPLIERQIAMHDAELVVIPD